MTDQRPQETCDLIMRGGITSGVAYPAAVSVLRERYQFASIGGASAGAIAAAVTAAAQHAPDGRGFERLEEVRAELATPGLLVQLFQTTRQTRPLFGLLLAVQTKQGKRAKARTAIVRLLPTVLLPLLVGALAAVALVAWVLGHAGTSWAALDWVAWTLLVLVVLVAAVVVAGAALAVRLVRVATRWLPASNFGMCTGLSPSAGADGPALTEWLHQRIQYVAGRRAERGDDPADTAPLTFAELAGATPPVTLQMMTTDLARARPVRLPLRESDAEYLFDLDELRGLFPPDVVAHLARCPVVPGAGRELRRLPEGDLPVVVATRMSLSFPVLLSAIPLWTRQGADEPVRHLMSDGGIASNFPIHLFDAWVPSRPTFGLNLASVGRETAPGTPADSFVSTYPTRPPQRRPVAITSLTGLFSRAVDTMQNWRDTMQSELAGFHDRIVDIELSPDEGGMNISMPQEVIARVDAKGAAAGQALLRDFDFDRHQLRRYHAFMGMLQEGLVAGTEQPPKPCLQVPWQSNLRAVMDDAARRGTHVPRADSWFAPAVAATDVLLADAERWLGADGSFRPDTPPRPAASMRISPDV